MHVPLWWKLHPSSKVRLTTKNNPIAWNEHNRGCSPENGKTFVVLASECERFGFEDIFGENSDKMWSFRTWVPQRTKRQTQKQIQTWHHRTTFLFYWVFFWSLWRRQKDFLATHNCQQRKTLKGKIHSREHEHKSLMQKCDFEMPWLCLAFWCVPCNDWSCEKRRPEMFATTENSFMPNRKLIVSKTFKQTRRSCLWGLNLPCPNAIDTRGKIQLGLCTMKL